MKLSTKLYLSSGILVIIILIVAGVSIHFVGGIPNLMKGHEKIRSLEFQVLELKKEDENFRKTVNVSFDAATNLESDHAKALSTFKQGIASTVETIKASNISSEERAALGEFEVKYSEYLGLLSKNIKTTASMIGWRAKIVPEVRKIEDVVNALYESVYAYIQRQNTTSSSSAISGEYEKLLKVRGLQNDFLQIRRREKDFFIREDLKYYKKNIEEADHMIQDALSLGAEFNGQGNKDATNQVVQIIKNYKMFMAGYVEDFKRDNQEKDNLIQLEKELFKLVNTVSDLANESLNSKMNSFYFMLTLFCGIAIAGLFISSIFIVRSITTPIIKSSMALKDIATSVNSSSQEVHDASENLATSANEQASSVAETSASVEELDGMVKNNLTDADRTSDLSSNVLSKVEDGMKAVQDLRDSSTAMAQSNARIQELVDVISAIGEKTKIIDEIVFQTKLLSFNASVEAERAGEHGRGFAVVAQEVGNLAQMSGKAALEISSIVNNSISQAKTITDENSNRVKSSSEMVERITAIFTEVERDSKDVASSAAGIKQASKEQSTGIEQINTAIVEIDKSVQTISSSAEQTSSASSELAEMSERMNKMVDQLSRIVFGGTKKDEIHLAESPSLIESPSFSSTPDTDIIADSADDFWEKDEKASAKTSAAPTKKDEDWDTL